ncbi:MAG: hypothetical protein IT292_12265 [Deltaproteobacteria bacterium]|nr:hypothetical protein [Deltaproteobacteria bacterium]
MKVIHILVAVLSLFIFALPCFSESSKSEAFVNSHNDFFHLLNSDPDDIKIGYYYQPETEEDGGPGEFELQKAFSRLELPLPTSNDAYFRMAMKYDYRNYDFSSSSGRAGSLSSEALHKIELGTGYGVFLTKDLLFTALPTFGIYSNMDGLSEDDFQFHGEFQFVYRLNPGAAIVAGAAYNEIFDDTPFYPILGVRILSNDGKTHLNITLPTEIKLAYNDTPQTQYYIGGWISGDQYHYEGDLGDFNIQVRENRVGGGVIQWFNDVVNIQLEAGAQINDEFEFETKGTNLFQNNLETAPYIWVALGFAL